MRFLADETGQLDQLQNTIGTLFTNTIIPIIMWAATLVGVIVCITIGWKLMNANSPEEQQQVKKKLLNWIIGTALIFMSSGLYSIIMEIVKGAGL